MAKKLVAYGIVEEGVIKITNRATMDKYLTSQPNGTHIEIIISPVKDFRSRRLNNTYWMYMTMVGDYVGYTKDEMHKVFKDKFLKSSLEVDDVKGIKSTADLNTQEFCEYLEQIFQYCAEEFELILPDIEEIKKLKNT